MHKGARKRVLALSKLVRRKIEEEERQKAKTRGVRGSGAEGYSDESSMGSTFTSTLLAA